MMGSDWGGHVKSCPDELDGDSQDVQGFEVGSTPADMSAIAAMFH